MGTEEACGVHPDCLLHTEVRFGCRLGVPHWAAGPVVAEGTHSPVPPQDEDKAEPGGRTCSQPSPGSEHCR